MIEKEYILKLIRKIKSGDNEAFEDFVNHTKKIVFSLAFHMLGNKFDAMDICQEVYFKIYKNIHLYQEDKDFNPWLYKIILNSCFDFIKNQSHKHENINEKNKDLFIFIETLEQDFSDKQLLTKVFEFLKILTPQERAVFILRDVKNLNTKEISKILGCTKITVRRHSNSARKKLRNFLSSLI